MPTKAKRTANKTTIKAKPAAKKVLAKPLQKLAKKTTKQPTKAVRKAAKGVPILRTDDIQEIVRDLGWRVAPRDVEQLIGEERELRAQADALTEPRYQLLRAQLSMALDILRDHVDGACPQIPLSTIAVLAAAVSYYSRTMDVIPDFLPHIGRLDDAAVMAMSFQLAEAGVRRYCDWKGLPIPTMQRRRSVRKVREALAALEE